MRTIEKVLVANRGEVALRIMRTCKRLGLATVAVYSDADAGAPHVRFADEAVHIGPSEAKESYLRIDAILKAAAHVGADAVHPGFGFLSENPEFAAACEKVGVCFIGPTAEAIRAMGLKREAKALVAKRGVPLVPGSDGGDQALVTLEAEALKVGLPVIFKPSAGGGGKGMRIVREAADLKEAIESGQREAQSSFGDPTLIIEKYLEKPRHVEIQVLADAHGTTLHLFERECSIQRRHQKIVEEAPSVALTPERRAQMGQAAVEAAKAVGYTNAGTVEFIVDQQGDFFFSEMNTRLQVEHRVTELVTGLDLVEQQLRVARGERLTFTQESLAMKGHAIQARLYAEDPANGFLPATGTLLDWVAPEDGNLVVDSGVEQGAEVSVHYDPMLAKLVAWGETRDDAVSRLRRALEKLVVAGVTTNRDFLVRLLSHPEFEAGRLHTGFIQEHLMLELGLKPSPRLLALGAIGAALAGHEQRRAESSHLPHVPSGFRNNRFADQVVEYLVDGKTSTVEYRAQGGGKFLVRHAELISTWRVRGWDEPALVVEDGDGVRQTVRVVRAGDRVYVHTRLGAVVLDEKPRFPLPFDEAVRGGFMAPMPGKVVKVLVGNGEKVKSGQVLLVLEAMKMEQTTRAPADGVVKEVKVREGDQVTAGQVLVVMEE